MSTVVTFILGLAATAFLADAASAQTPGAMPPRPRPGMAKPEEALPAEVSKPTDLTDTQLQGFFAALDELKAAGTDEAAKNVRNPAHPASFASGLKLSAESTSILQKHGFKDTIEFQRVGYNAAMAYAVLQQGGKAVMAEKVKKADSEQAKALEKLKQQVSPEQYASLEQQLNTAMSAARAMKDVPDANIELIKKYQGKMASLAKK